MTLTFAFDRSLAPHFVTGICGTDGNGANELQMARDGTFTGKTG